MQLRGTRGAESEVANAGKVGGPYLFTLKMSDLSLRHSSPSGESHRQRDGTRAASQAPFKSGGCRLKNLRPQQGSINPFPSRLKTPLVDDDLDSWQEEGEPRVSFPSCEHRWKPQPLAHPAKGSVGAARSPAPVERLRLSGWGTETPVSGRSPFDPSYNPSTPYLREKTS